MTSNAISKCPYCGKSVHADILVCPVIKAVEYYPNGSIKRIEKITSEASLFGQVFGKQS